jgi:hypothetical protein
MGRSEVVRDVDRRDVDVAERLAYFVRLLRQPAVGGALAVAVDDALLDWVGLGEPRDAVPSG